MKNYIGSQNKNIYRLLRIARDIKVKDLAEELQVTPAYINAIENGDRKPSKRLKRSYATALGIDENTLDMFENIDSRNLSFEKFLLNILATIVMQSDDVDR